MPYKYVLGALALMPSVVSAHTLWQNTSVGMSPAAVRAAQPTAAAESSPAKLSDGATCDLKIGHYAVGGDDFSVCFFFEHGKLEQVMLGENSTPSLPDCMELINLLRAKYGKEISSGPDAIGYEAEWMTPQKVNVGVTYIGIGGSPLLNIYYQVRIAQDSGRL